MILGITLVLLWANFLSELVHTTKSFVIRLPVTVSNRLNARQSEIFTKIPQKTSWKPFESIRCLLRNVDGLQKVMLVFECTIRWFHRILICRRDNFGVTAKVSTSYQLHVL